MYTCCNWQCRVKWSIEIINKTQTFQTLDYPLDSSFLDILIDYGSGNALGIAYQHLLSPALFSRGWICRSIWFLFSSYHTLGKSLLYMPTGLCAGWGIQYDETCVIPAIGPWSSWSIPVLYTFHRDVKPDAAYSLIADCLLLNTPIGL